MSHSLRQQGTRNLGSLAGVLLAEPNHLFIPSDRSGAQEVERPADLLLFSFVPPRTVGVPFLRLAFGRKGGKLQTQITPKTNPPAFACYFAEKWTMNKERPCRDVHPPRPMHPKNTNLCPCTPPPPPKKPPASSRLERHKHLPINNIRVACPPFMRTQIDQNMPFFEQKTCKNSPFLPIFRRFCPQFCPAISRATACKPHPL